MPTLLSEAEGYKEVTINGEVILLHSGVGGPTHAETFNVRNLGGPEQGLIIRANGESKL